MIFSKNAYETNFRVLNAWNFSEAYIEKKIVVGITTLNFTLTKVVADSVIDNLTAFISFGIKKERLLL